MKRIIVLLMFYFLFASCASTSIESEKVLVTSKPERIEGCKFMGPVESSSIWVDFHANGIAFDNAMHELKNEAKQKGANVVLRSSSSNTMGDAYQCN